MDKEVAQRLIDKYITVLVLRQEVAGLTEMLESEEAILTEMFEGLKN